MLIRERVAFKRTAQRKVRDDARKADEERLAALADTGPKRIPRGVVAIAVAKRPGANYEKERQKALAKGGAPVPLPMARPATYGSLAERARTSTEALAALPSNMPVLPLPAPAPAQAKSVRWQASS